MVLILTRQLNIDFELKLCRNNLIVNYIFRFENTGDLRVQHDVCTAELNFEYIILKHINNAGLWCGANGYRIHWMAKISIFSFLIINITHIIAVFQSRGDPKILFTCFSILAFCFVGFMKLWSLTMKQQNWHILIVQASFLENNQFRNNNTYDCESDEDNIFPVYINTYTKKFSTVSVCISRLYWFSLILYMIAPFIEFAFYSYQEKDIKGLPHILQGWAPLDGNAFGYIITIVAEILCSIYCVRVHISFDVIAIGFMIYVRGQFSLLRNYSERIGGKGDMYKLSRRRDHRAHNRIKRCHNIHVLLLKLVNLLSKLLQNILGIYFFLVTFTLCSVAIQLKWGQPSIAQIISLLQYMGASVTQLFILCHYGGAVFNESCIGQGEGPLCSASWCLSSKIRREIAILGIGMSRPCKMLAGPFDSLDLPSFIQIVSTAYSYYAVLRPSSE